jgi:hypothetical protein
MRVGAGVEISIGERGRRIGALPHVAAGRAPTGRGSLAERAAQR